jgi:hypothetical protein
VAEFYALPRLMRRLRRALGASAAPPGGEEPG